MREDKPLQLHQQGGALVECSILGTLILLLFSLIVFIGKIVDTRQATIQASRYAAWEQTVNPEFQAPLDIKARFYQQLDQKLVSFSAGAGHFLDSNGGGDALAIRAGSGILNAGRALEPLENVDWSLESDGLVTAGVQVNIANNHLQGRDGKACNGETVKGLFGCVSAHNSIMVDGWGVASNELAEQRTRALVPGAALQKTGNALAKVGKIPFLKEFKGLENAFGLVDSTVLPLDRFSGTYIEAAQ